jgi:hypothetical protein
VFGVLDSIVPPANRTYWPGWGPTAGNLNNVNTDNLPKNILHRTSNPWSGAATSTADGYPLTFDSGGNVSSYTWSTSLGNWIDSSEFPIPWDGTWTVVGDETDPAHPEPIILTPNTEAVALLTGPVITPGVVDGSGVERGKRWDWTSSQGVPGAFLSTLTIKVSKASGAPTSNVTLKNLAMYSAGDSVVPITTANDINDLVLQSISFSPSKSISLGRYLTAYPAPSAVDPEDYAQAGLFSQTAAPLRPFSDWAVNSPTFSGTRTIPLYQARRYDLSVTPLVYSKTQWSLSGSTRWTAVTGSPGLYQFRPTDWGLDWTWFYANAGSTNQCVVEFVSALSDGTPVPHNLKSGQFVSFPTFTTINCSNSVGSGLVKVADQTDIWVTSPTTFLAHFASTCPNTTSPAQVTGTQTINQSGTCTVLKGPNVTIEQMALITKANGTPAYWLTLPHAVSDAGCRAWATRAKSVMAPGAIVWLQLSNEQFIPNYIYGFFQHLATVLGLAANNSVPGYVQRAHECHLIWQDVWGADAANVKLLFQPWTVNPGHTTDGLTYAHANSIPIDGICIAPYVNNDFSPTIQMMYASAFADSVDSIAHTTGPGGGQCPIMPMSALHNQYQLWLKYNKDWNWSTGFCPQHVAAARATGYGQGGAPSGFVYPMPQMMTYEGGISSVVPPGVSQTKKIYRTGLSHDFMYHPAMKDTVWAWCEHAQQPGGTGTQGYASGCVTSGFTPRSIDFNNSYTCTDGIDNNSCELWGNAGIWQGIPRGDGAANTFWSTTLGGNGKSNDIVNQSVSAYGFQTWTLGVVPPPPPSPASFVVHPTQVNSNTSTAQSIALSGTMTTWTSGSTISVTNSLSGATAVTAGTFTATSNIAASLGVTTGAGVGTWRITVDGIDGPLMTTVAPGMPSFLVSPSQVTSDTSTSQVITLTGTLTTWTSSSVVSVANSLTGTTAIMAGTFTASSNTAATLAVTTGSGIGTWQITIDGVSGPLMTTIPPPPPPPPPTFTVTPTQVFSDTGMSQLVTLAGTSTTWSSGSAVSVVNSVAGTTSITAGAFTVSSATAATLAVTTGPGIGAWRIMIDGISGPTMTTQLPPPPVGGSTLTIVVGGLLGTQLVTQGLGQSIPIPPILVQQDVITALQGWWQSNPVIPSAVLKIHPSVQATSGPGTLPELLSDGRLHHLQAPQGVKLPYVTYFKVADPVETFTTAYGYRRALVQFNCHAATDARAQTIADTFCDTMRTLGGNAGAPLTVYGQRALDVLPHSFTIEIGEGLGDGGNDCWIASFEVEISYTK